MSIVRNKEVFKSFELQYWDYYLDLENDFLNTKKYVDFSRGNLKTYSLEFLKLYEAVCSEIDVVGKVMAKYVDNNYKDKKSNSIKDWWDIIKNHYYLVDGRFTPMNNTNSTKAFKIEEYKCYLLDNIELQPWKDIKCENNIFYTPSWWKDYNKLKHRRITLSGGALDDVNYKKANLINTSNAFAGLYVLEKAFMDLVGTQNDLESFASHSKLFVKRKIMTSEEIDKIFNELNI